MITPRAPEMLVSSSGLEMAALAASSALSDALGGRRRPCARKPASFMMVRTSAKSRLMKAGTLIRLGDALHALAQHVVGRLKGVHAA